MAKKKKRQEEEPKELTRKQVRQNARDRERNRKLYFWTAITMGAVLVVVVVGILAEFVWKPTSTLAQVNDDKIVTRDFWKRVRLEDNQLRNQYVQLQQLEAQFGGQGVFTSQLNQIEATLSSPFSLGVQVLDQMIEEKLIQEAAAARGITVTDEEVDAEIRREVASAQGAITEPQATATAEAAAEATAVATAWTPTPTVEAAAPITGTDGITATDGVTTPLELPTPEPPPTRPILVDSDYQEGLSTLESNLQTVAGISLAEYREIVRNRLLSDKLAEVIAEEEVTTTEEQVRARHILLREITPTPEPTAVPEGEPTPEPTLTPTPLPPDAPTPTATPAPRDREATLALAQELRQRILDGEEFADIAAEYSQDFSNAANGGDLGWFGRGMMVAPFEEAAFSLPVGEVSEPVETDFGFHLIEVLERDENRPKDEAQVQQDRALAFQNWLQEQVVAADITRPTDLTARMPGNVAQGVPLPQP